MNYKEWSETAQSEGTYELGRDGIRDIYTLPNGIIINNETYLPRNIFAKQYNLTLVDFIFHRSQEEWLKEKFGISWLDYERYTEEDYGYAIFFGDNSCEKAFNFAMQFPIIFDNNIQLLKKR